jgi:hypothetical protein
MKTLAIQIFANVFLLLGIIVNDVSFTIRLVTGYNKVPWPVVFYIAAFFNFISDVVLCYSLCQIAKVQLNYQLLEAASILITTTETTNSLQGTISERALGT